MADAGTRARLGDREGALGWVFLTPTVVYVVALVGVPFGLAIAFAFSDVTSGDPSYDWARHRDGRELISPLGRKK